MRKLLLIGLFLLPRLALAADNAPPDQLEDEATPELELVADDTEQEATQPTDGAEELILADIVEDATDEAKSPGRFIPTEQISQDLGVSFPVDI